MGTATVRPRRLLSLVLILGLIFYTFGVSSLLAVCQACDDQGECNISPWDDWGGHECEKRCQTLCWDHPNSDTSCITTCFCAVTDPCDVVPTGPVENLSTAAGEPTANLPVPNPTREVRDALGRIFEDAGLPAIALFFQDRNQSEYRGMFLTTQRLEPAVGEAPTPRVERYPFLARVEAQDDHARYTIVVEGHPTLTEIDAELWSYAAAGSLSISWTDGNLTRHLLADE